MEKKLPNPLDEPQLPNPLTEPELPKPDEKLLPKPTFNERYGWLKPIAIVALAVVCIDVGIVSILNSENKDQPLAIQASKQTPTISSWKTYTSQSGKFSIEYPIQYTLADNPQTVPQSIVITSNTLEKINTSFKLTLHYQQSTTNQTLDQFIEQHKSCPSISAKTGMQATLNENVVGKMYKDVPCQQSFKTVFYTLNKKLFYVVTIDTQEKFDTIKPYLDPIFATLKFLP